MNPVAVSGVQHEHERLAFGALTARLVPIIRIHDVVQPTIAADLGYHPYTSLLGRNHIHIWWVMGPKDNAGESKCARGKQCRA